MEKHFPVLLKESIELLNIQSDGIYVDCTLGRAGHTIEILKHLKSGKLFSFDQDKSAVDECKYLLEKYPNNLNIINSNFNFLKLNLAINKINSVNGILYDLGVSSPQFDIAERGFSYRFDGPLDMRMDQINTTKTAYDVVNFLEQKEIEKILFTGGEKFAKSIASKIVLKRENEKIATTLQLVNVIRSALPSKVLNSKGHPAKKTFQALRIWVNDELNVLENSLLQALELLSDQGIIVVITFQPDEEEIVKKVFKKITYDENEKFYSKLPVQIEYKKEYELVIKKPIKASKSELEINNRSHSAKLWAIKRNKGE